MKFRNQFLKYKMNSNAGGDGQGGGGNGSAGDGGDGNDGDGAENKGVDFSGMWHNNSQQSNDNGDGQQQQQNNQQQQQQQQSPQDVFSKHMEGLDFGSAGPEFQQAMQSGDPEQISTAMRGMQEGMYRTMMMSVNTLVQQQMDTVRKEAENNASTAVESNKMMEQMHNELPFTKQPAYAPMAKAVFTQLLGQDGMTTAKAIEETGNYFQGMAADVSKTLSNAPDGKPNGAFGSFVPNNGNNGDAGPDVDWVELLGGKPDGN